MRGVVLARDLPHLSHLAIRARQEKVPLAATEDPATLAAARSLVGQQVTLTITPGGVTLQRATEAEIAAAKAAEEGTGAGAVAAGAGAGAAAAAAAAMSADREVELIERVEFVALGSAVVGTAGGKAATCGDLTRVAQRPASGFKAPQGVFLPFGAMVGRRNFKPVFKAPGFSA